MASSKRSYDESSWPDAVDDARQAYNIVCKASSAVDERGGNRAVEEVARKTANFVKHFSSRVAVYDLCSQKPILADAAKFQKRYSTVFRESGPGLELSVLARTIFLPREHGSPSATSALVLDYERHRSLVTPIGAALDGSLGLRPSRQQDLWALYAVSNCRIDALWLCPPPEGMDASVRGEAALAVLRRSGKVWACFQQVVERHLGPGYSMRDCAALYSSRVGSHEMQGRRPTQEDKLSVHHLPAPHLARPAARVAQWLGLFDGHGGAACSHFAAEHLHQKLTSTADFAAGRVRKPQRRACVCEAPSLPPFHTPLFVRPSLDMHTGARLPSRP